MCTAQTAGKPLRVPNRNRRKRSRDPWRFYATSGDQIRKTQCRIACGGDVAASRGSKAGNRLVGAEFSGTREDWYNKAGAVICTSAADAVPEL